MPKIIKTKRLSKKIYNTPTLYAFSVIKGLIVALIGVLLCSFMVLRSTQSNFFYYCIYIFIALGAFLGSYDASKKINGKGFIKGLIASGIFCGVIFALIVVIIRFNVSAFILLLLPLCLISGFAGGILGVK